ncbi:MAG: RNA ligase family protein [Candidatus Diapherotrites archaeon]
MEVKNFPKLESPFKREFVNEVFIVVPKLSPEFEWIFSNECIASDKIDGTNVSIIVESHKITEIYNRMNKIDIWKHKKWFFEGIKNAIDFEKINLKELSDGQYFGELVGPHINGNPYNLKEPFWLSFDFLRKHCRFKFWDEFTEQNRDKTEKEKFLTVSETFKGLWSIYKRQKGIKSEVNESTGFENSMAAEGIVFYNKASGEMCKLRRDMFEWYSKPRHKKQT